MRPAHRVLECVYFLTYRSKKGAGNDGREGHASTSRLWRPRPGAILLLEVAILVALPISAEPVAGSEPAEVAERQAALAAKVVSRARRLALGRLTERRECRSLFEDLGHSGERIVARATFRLADTRERSEICRRRKAIMFTTMHGSEIVVCYYNFVAQPLRSQAAILLHEALHHAGLSEQPLDPQGLTPQAITRLVERHCNL